MAAALTVAPLPAPVGSVVRVTGSNFANAKTRLTLDGAGSTTNIFRPASDGTFHVGITVATTVKSQTLVAEQQQSGGSWTVVARLTPLLTFLPPVGADTTPPVITTIQASTITSTSEAVSWITNEQSTSRVDYGTTAGYGSNVTNASRVTTHILNITGLAAATLYHYKVTSVDAAGNTSVSADQTFTTAAAGGSLTITAGPTATVGGAGTSVSITWTLSTFATGQVLYGLTPALGSLSTKETSFNYQTHVQTIGSLTPGQTYYYKVTSTDASGNSVTSVLLNFTTQGGGGGGGGGSFDATFTGTNSGNQGNELAVFIAAHRGQNLAISGIVRVQGSRTQAAIRLDTLTGDFAETTITGLPGSKILCTGVSYGIWNLNDVRDLTFVDLEVQGSGYTWLDPNSDGEDPDGVEDGFGIYGCRRITINNCYVHDNRGDGIYIGTASGFSSAIVLNNVTLFKNARNNVGHICGDVTMTGGSMDYAGLHNYDMEPNNGGEAATIDVTIDGVSFGHTNNIPVVAGQGYSIGGQFGGGAGTNKVAFRCRNSTFDHCTVAISNMNSMEFTNNTSVDHIDGDSPQFDTLEFTNCGSKTPANAAAFNASNHNIQDPTTYS